MIVVEDIHVTFGRGTPLEKHALRGVDLTIPEGEFVTVIGSNGAGKSTFLGSLAGDVLAEQGRISIDGTDVTRWDTPRRAGLVARVFQDPMAALNPVMPVGRQVTEQIRAHRAIGEAEALAEAAKLLGQMGLEAGRVLRAYPFQLSGGQRQRVMIAMALALGPRLLIADEPTTALDVTTQAQIIRLLKDIQAQRGMSVLFITHDFGVVADIADKVAVMRHGRIVESGPAAQVLGHPSDPYTKSLIDAVPRFRNETPPLASGTPLVTVNNLGKTFQRGGLFSRDKPVAALDSVSLTVGRGETLGIVGESGSGKSTLARCIIRLLDPCGWCSRTRSPPSIRVLRWASSSPPGRARWARMRRRRRRALPRCCGWWVWTRPRCAAIRMNFPAASASASGWRVR